jgi:formylglycine-generating enzyme required for sulfatase activity
LADPSGNNANYCSGSGAYPIDSGTYYTTVVGQFGNSASPYGTFDQGGNVWEWTEGVHTQYGVGSWRVSRGGSFVLNNVCEIGQEYSLWNNPSSPSLMLGFRVAQVPEPATLALLALGAVGVLMRRKLK